MFKVAPKVLAVPPPLQEWQQISQEGPAVEFLDNQTRWYCRSETRAGTPGTALSNFKETS